VSGGATVTQLSVPTGSPGGPAGTASGGGQAEAEAGADAPAGGRRWVLHGVTLAVVLAVWQVLGAQQPRTLSYPSQVVDSAWDLIVVEDRLLPALGTTLWGLAIGFAISVVGGVVIGFAMGRNRLVEIILQPYVSALYATPRIALVPLLVLWTGIDLKLRVVVVVLSAIFPVAINTYKGARNVDTDLVETGMAFAASRRQLLRTVVVPASVPYVFAGVRVGIVRALIGVIVAEMTAAVTGTGRLIITLGNFFQTGRLLVPIMALGLLGILLSRLVVLVQRWLAPWSLREAVR
jgi:ABC-type nitrate/sulfonate/bicarbonate transport system permease component